MTGFCSWSFFCESNRTDSKSERDEVSKLKIAINNSDLSSDK